MARIALSGLDIEALMSGVDLDRLKVLPARPSWWADAACRAHPEVNFFPAKGEATAPAKAVCAECPSREPCLAFAVEEHIDHGVWGGQSAQDRRRGRAGAGRRRPKPGGVRADRWPAPSGRRRRQAGWLSPPEKTGVPLL